MSVEANEVALARIVDELLNGQDLDVLDELVHPDYVDGYGGFRRDHYRELLLQTFAVFPDMFLTVEDVVGEGDVVVGRSRARTVFAQILTNSQSFRHNQVMAMRPGSRIACTECPSTTGVRLRERTNPANYHVWRRLLCVKCGTRLGYAAPR